MKRELGRLEAGASADLVLFYYNPGTERLQIETVMRSGIMSEAGDNSLR
jgi:hypothetical protein